MFLMSQLHYSLQPLATTHKKFGRKVDLGGCQLPCDHFGRKEVASVALKINTQKPLRPNISCNIVYAATFV